MISTRSLLSVLFAWVIVIVHAPACWAGDHVKVTVVAVLATSQNKEVDPKLECLAKAVQEKDPTLTGFRIANWSCKELAKNTSSKFTLVDEEVVEVSIQQGPGQNDRVKLAIKPPKAREIVYSCCCGKYFPVFTFYQTKDKEQLIIAVRCQCCDK